MEVRPDKVTVLADAAESADEIDEQRAEAARKRGTRLDVAKSPNGVRTLSRQPCWNKRCAAWNCG